MVNNPAESSCLILPGEELPKPDCTCGFNHEGNRAWQGCKVDYSDSTSEEYQMNTDCGKYRNGVDFNIEGKTIHLLPSQFIYSPELDHCTAFFEVEDSSFHYIFQGVSGSKMSGFDEWEKILNCTGPICDQFEYHTYSAYWFEGGEKHFSKCKNDQVIDFNIISQEQAIEDCSKSKQSKP